MRTPATAAGKRPAAVSTGKAAADAGRHGQVAEALVVDDLAQAARSASVVMMTRGCSRWRRARAAGGRAR
jgi:hypothetical protein